MRSASDEKSPRNVSGRVIETFRPKRLLLTGASGGIGGALARHFARPGVHLALWGRDLARLTAVAEVCRAAGASAEVRSLDITDLDAALDALLAEDQAEPIDLALFASGLGDIRAPGAKVEDARLVARLAAINFAAPTTLAAALAGRMAARGHGNIVLIGSAAAFHALPFAAAIRAARRALRGLPMLCALACASTGSG
jgi:short-subunit dehydrogenase